VSQRSFKVLMIAPTSFFADYGCHVRILEETLALQALGHRVKIVTYHMGRPVANLDIVRTRPLPWRPDYEVGSSRHKIAFDAYLTATTWRTAWSFKPDVIHAHLHEGALIGAPLARLMRRPLIFDLQGSLTSEMVDHHFLQADGPLYRSMRSVERLINRLPQAILTSSLHARHMLQEEFNIKPSRIHPLPDCVNADTFRPHAPATRDAVRRQVGIPPGRPVVVYLGLLADYQGTPDLIQAAAQLKREGTPAHFLIMGYPGADTYLNMARQLGVDDLVTLTGKIPYEQAPRYLAAGDVAVAPKLSATEGSGKVLNYMAMGLPTVAYDTPVQREYLADLGAYAPAGDVEGLAAAIRDLLADPERQQTLGAALRQRAIEQYSWNQAGKQIVNLYERLHARKQDGHDK
jgi:glycosyltransferase involved in cell wall biosynthesis